MAYDEVLAARVRRVLARRKGFGEKKMFGGMCFLIGGHMACGVVDGDLMVRVGPDAHDEALTRPHARPMDFTGRPMKGMVFVGPGGTGTDDALREWAALGVAHARSLPPKDAPKAKAKAKAAGRKKTAEEVPPFGGFGAPTFRFLREIEKNNDKAWFEAHRDLYEAGYVDAGRAFVSAIGPRLVGLSKSVAFEPRVNGSIFRIHRDVRFSKDKTPYKTHLSLRFWQTAHRGYDTPGFFFRLSARRLILGAGVHAFGKDSLTAYREAVVDARCGKALEKAIAEVAAAGPYEIHGANRKRVPAGYDADHPRAALLLHDGLAVVLDRPVPKEARRPELVDWAVDHYAAMLPVHRWLERI